MPTANVRYGRPRGSGLDDRQQLLSIAALLAANPKLKPTTAIRSLGVEDPSTIRRLRDKFRGAQGALMADAHRATRSSAQVTAQVSKPANANTRAQLPRPASANRVSVLPPMQTAKPRSSQISPSGTFVAGMCDLSCAALSTIVESQALVAQYWLAQPHVAAAFRAQLAANSVVIALATRKKHRPHVLK
jgi:hypothetical protein